MEFERYKGRQIVNPSLLQITNVVMKGGGGGIVVAI